MLEPRRLAASNAARFMAKERGERVGETVGYAIRYERKVSKATRIEVVTEGILTRRLQADPELSGVGLVIFDEFHERNLNSDLALALCRDAQLGLREDLKLLVMSATLDAGPVAQLLGDCPRISSAGRSYPVEVRYLGAGPAGAGGGLRAAGGAPGARAKRRATCWSFSPAPSRSAAAPRPWPTSEAKSTSAPSTASSPSPSRSGRSCPAPGARWCWRPTSPRPA